VLLKNSRFPDEKPCHGGYVNLFTLRFKVKWMKDYKPPCSDAGCWRGREGDGKELEALPIQWRFSWPKKLFFYAESSGTGWKQAELSGNFSATIAENTWI
jgi:hypothetical protein